VNSQLILIRGIIAVYSENHRKRKHTNELHGKKKQCFLLLKWVVHIVTTCLEEVKHYTMDGMKVWLHVLTSALDEGEWLVSHSIRKFYLVYY
jgi:hypothetical protein